MAIFKCFEPLTTSIKRSVSQQFYRHAKFCATNQVFVIVTAIFIVLPLCYPALNAYYLNPTSDVPTFFWELPSSRVPISKSSFQQKCGTQPSIHVESIIIKTDYSRVNDIENPNDSTNVLTKELLLWAHQLQKTLANTVILYPPNNKAIISRQKPEEYTLSSLCFKPNGGDSCLVHSPLEFWNYDADLLMSDENISNTLSIADKVSSFKIPIPLESIFGNPIYDKVTGRIISADSIILTYFFEDMGKCADGQTLAIWDLLWKHVMDANDTFYVGGERIKAYMDFKEASNHIVFTFNRNKEFPAEFVLLSIEYLVVFLYISLSLGRLNSVKSKFGLAFSTLAQVFTSLIMSLSLCSLFGITLTLVSWKILPFVLIILGVENMFILTNAVTSTSMELDVKERVGKGLEKVGASMTKNLFTSLVLLFLCSNIDLVQEFCIFVSVAMIIDYLLQMSFFITTLSIDLRRLEISDLYNRRVGTPLKTLKTRNKLNNGVRDGTLTSSSNGNGRMAIYLMIIIFTTATINMYQTNGDFSSLLSSFKGNIFSDSPVNRNTVGNITTNIFYETSTAAHAEAFWNVVNPKKRNQYFEIRHPRKFTLLWALDQTNNLTESIESEESSESPPFLLEIAGTKLSVRSIIKNFVWFLKFIISPAFGIIFATSSLVDSLVSSDQIGKDVTSNGGSKISMPAPFYRNSLSLIATTRVVTLRGRHSADVSLLCANPSGMIISTATDKHITSWDGRRGVSLRKLERYMRKCDSCKCGITGGMKKCISWPVRAMCMSEKIELAAAGFEDGVVRVWDINSGQATYILKDTVEDVESVLTAMNGNTARDRVTCLQFVVPTSSSSMPQTPTYEHGYINFSARPISIQQAPAMLLATYRNGYFREWDLVSGQIVHTISTNQKGGISYLCVADDGELDYHKSDLCIFTGARDGSVKCWVRSTYYSENETSFASAIDPNGLRKSRWKSIYTIPGETGNAITCISTELVKTANSTYGIVITGAADGEVRVYDYLTGKPITILSRGTIFKRRREKEIEERLLQKRLFIQQQKLKGKHLWSQKNNVHNNCSSSDSDWYDDDFDDDEEVINDEVIDDEEELWHQDAITNIIINLLNRESCPCGKTEYGGFQIVTSSVDEKVHVWQLVRNVMDCTCIALRVENNANGSKDNDAKNGPAGYLKQKEVAEWNGVISYQPKFVGRVKQPGGSAIVFIRNNIIGVRKVKHSLASKHGIPRCHGAEGEWEMWMLEINDPKVIESTQDQENSDNEIEVAELLVQTIPLVNEADLFTEEQQKKKKEAHKLREKESTTDLKGFVRRRRNIINDNNVVGSNLGPTFPLPSNNHDHSHHNHHNHNNHHEEDTQGQVIDYRQKNQRRRGSALHRIYPNDRQLSLLDEEGETNEFLPFAQVRQVVKIGDGGVAVAYGNFVKVVLFEGSGDHEFRNVQL